MLGQSSDLSITHVIASGLDRVAKINRKRQEAMYTREVVLNPRGVVRKGEYKQNTVCEILTGMVFNEK